MFQLHDYQETLVSRTRQAYLDGKKSPCVVAPCGAGKSVIISEIARLTTLKGNHVLFLVHRKELIDQIRNTFQKNEVDLKCVNFGMVQTVVRKLDKIPIPDLIITDESHHGLASSYKKIYEYFEDVLRLGFTATPIRLNGDGMGEVNDILIEEVDAEWLIENKFLSPYKYYAPKLIDTSLLEVNNLSEFSNKSIDAAMSKRTIFGDVIKHYRELADGEQTIVYCHSIESSKATKEAFTNQNIVAEHIDAKTPKLERDEIIAKFRNKEIQILCNVDLIGEGFDVPDCSTVIMLRPTKSLSLFIQQSMRGMRYQPDKVSIIIDHVDNVRVHGLPDAKRTWSLAKKQKKKQDMATILVKQCLNCYMTVGLNSKKCPECGHEFEVEESAMTIDNDAELQQVTKADIEIVLDFREPEDCKSMADLYALAKSRNYKSGWAYHQGKLLGFIN